MTTSTVQQSELGDSEAEPVGGERNPGRLWAMDQQYDKPLGAEAEHVRSMHHKQAVTLGAVLRLAYQSLGVVYGDLGTSPLYVFKSTFVKGVQDRDDIIGALSLILYTLTIIALIKYIFIVLRANDNGEGGTFALYSLLCRYCNISALPNQHPTDVELTTYFVDNAPKKTFVQKKLEGSYILQKLLLVIVLFGTCMVIGDGVLTPAISVLSAVVGIKAASPKFDNNWVTVISLIVLVILFSLQRFGTARISFLFAPIFVIWFLSLALIGCYNIIQWDASVFRAFNPMEIVYFFKRNQRSGWEHLGGIVLCMTGTEAMFADLGHFSFRSIQIAFTSVVYPCMIVTYIGQAAYLVKHMEDVTDSFYSSIPGKIYWPMFVLATISAMIASQAIITATFSIIKQSAALGCFPRVKVVHTSNNIAGQVYIPEINWILMVLCLGITAGFRDTDEIGTAYGIAVVMVMLVTTLLIFLVMMIVWRQPFLLSLLFLLVFATIEGVFVSAVLFKTTQGGWVPLVLAVVFGTIMYTWHYGTLKRFQYEMQHKVSVGWLLGLGPSLGLVRVPGIGLMYTDLAHGVPPLFSHFITNLPAIHSTVVFVCIKYLPVATVPQEERFLIRRIGPRSYSMYRCAARYGYMDIHKKDDNFEHLLIDSLAQFLRMESIHGPSDHMSLAASWTPDEQQSLASMPTMSSASPNRAQMLRILQIQGLLMGSHSHSHPHGRPHQGASLEEQQPPSESGISVAEMHVPMDDGDMATPRPPHDDDNNNSSSSSIIVSDEAHAHDEVAFLHAGRDAGVVYILGNNVLKARKDAGFLKKLAINYIYTFLRRISRESRVVLHIPHECLLQVGMVYYV